MRARGPVSRPAGRTRSAGAFRRPRRTVTAAVLALGLGLAAALAGCSASEVTVGAHPTPPPLEVGGVVTADPSPSAAAPATCNVEASSLAPTDTDFDGPTLQAIKQRGRLRVGVSDDGDLTGFLDPTTHQEEGFDVDIANQVAQAIFGTATGHIQFVAVTNAERITDITDGSIDMTVDTMTITCDRLQQVAFSSVYFEAEQQLLVLKNSGITSIAQLGGQKVCAADNSTSIATIQADPAHPIAYGVLDFSDCLVALQQNNAVAASTDNTILAGLAKQDPNTVVVGSSLENEPYGIAMSKQAPDLEEFVNGVLEQIRSNGTWEEIYNKWFGGILSPTPPPTAHYAD